MFRRYAIYYTPGNGPLAAFGAAWLGWDIAHGKTVPHIAAGDLDVAAITRAPRRYGFHATLKPPFRLSDGTTADELARAVKAVAAQLPTAVAPGLALSAMGRFLVLESRGDAPALSDLAAETVRRLDRFRAPLTVSELEQRQAAHLSRTQTSYLRRWGYPHVMEDFRFHITLTGRLARADLAPVSDMLRPRLQPLLSRAFVIDALTLVGEDANGMFHAIGRYPLAGPDQSRP